MIFLGFSVHFVKISNKKSKWRLHKKGSTSDFMEGVKRTLATYILTPRSFKAGVFFLVIKLFRAGVIPYYYYYYYYQQLNINAQLKL